MDMRFKRARRWWQSLPSWILPLGGLTLGFWALFWWRLDPDFGWHVRSGWYILAHGIPSHDIYTYTAMAFPWVNHEWLSDVVMAVLFNLGGFGLVTALYGLAWASAMVIAVRSGRWTIFMAAFLAVAGIVTARPNAWTALGLALTLYLLRRAKWRWLPPLFLLWANLHGGFVLGLGVVLWSVARARRHFGVVLLCAAVTFVNPYGPHLYEEIWRTLGDAHLHSSVIEWRPLNITYLNVGYLVVFLGAVVAARWRPETWLPLAIFGAGVMSLRHFPLFVVASLQLVNEAYERLLRLVIWPKIRARLWLVPASTTALMVAATCWLVSRPDVRTPVAQVAQLRAQPCRGALFNDYDFGGYLIWQLPDIKIYIDGRMPSWRYQGEFYLANWDADINDAGATKRDFARYDIGCVLVLPRRQRLIRQLKTEGWQVSSADSQAVLLRR